MASFDGESEWLDLMNDVLDGPCPSPQDKYVRLNIQLPKEALRIDDPQHMENLRREVSLQAQARQSDWITAFSLLASRLYFELDGKPLPCPNGLYHCRGTIHCRWPGRQLAQATDALRVMAPRFLYNGVLLATVHWGHDTCPMCGRFRARVELFTRNLKKPLTISLQGSDIERSISAFPQSMHWFIQQQHLDEPFGDAKHGSPGKYHCDLCHVATQRNYKAGCPKRKPRQSMGTFKRMKPF